MPSSLPSSSSPRRVSAGLVERVLGVLHNWAEAGWAGPAVGLWGFLQSAIVPGPSDALFAPLGIADNKRVPYLGLWTIVGAILGGLAAYAIGAVAFHVIGGSVLDLLGIPQSELANMDAQFATKGWIVIVIGALPLMSSKLVAFTAGALGFPIPTFVLVWSLVRIVRTVIVGALLYFGGPTVERWLRKSTRNGKETQQ